MHFQFFLRSASVLALSTVLFSCAESGKQRWQAKTTQNYKQTFTSVGYALIAPQKGDTFDMQMLNAIKASKLEAYKELAEQVHGALVKAQSTVEGARLKSDLIASEVKGLVRGARVLKSYHEGDMYITELELNMQTLPFLRAPEFNTQVIHIEKQIYY